MEEHGWTVIVVDKDSFSDQALTGWIGEVREALAGGKPQQTDSCLTVLERRQSQLIEKHIELLKIGSGVDTPRQTDAAGPSRSPRRALGC